MKNKIKIGILTFHKSINYGSLLQALSMQHKLVELGYCAEIIDYEPRVYNMQYGIFNKEATWSRTIVQNLNRFLVVDISLLKKITFEKFRNKYLKLSREKYMYDSDFERLNAEYDVIICGSDQIWNTGIMDCDPIYFLPIKHQALQIAYAISINNATYLEDKCDDSLRKNISKFDLISLREFSGAERIKDFIHSEDDISVVLDPTLLQSKEFFEEFTADRIIKEPYIFLYTISCRDSSFEAAKILSARCKMPVYSVVVTKTFVYLYKIHKKGVKTFRWRNGPKEFLSFIKNADLIITSSFHGTALSIIMEKQFVAINDIGEDGKYINDERITTLLRILELESLYMSVDELIILDKLMKIDYKVVREKRKIAADKSLNLLMKNIDSRFRHAND